MISAILTIFMFVLLLFNKVYQRDFCPRLIHALGEALFSNLKRSLFIYELVVFSWLTSSFFDLSKLYAINTQSLLTIQILYIQCIIFFLVIVALWQFARFRQLEEEVVGDRMVFAIEMAFKQKEEFSIFLYKLFDKYERNDENPLKEEYDAAKKVLLMRKDEVGIFFSEALSKWQSKMC